MKYHKIERAIEAALRKAWSDSTPGVKYHVCNTNIDGQYEVRTGYANSVSGRYTFESAGELATTCIEKDKLIETVMTMVDVYKIPTIEQMATLRNLQIPALLIRTLNKRTAREWIEAVKLSLLMEQLGIKETLNEKNDPVYDLPPSGIPLKDQRAFSECVLLSNFVMTARSTGTEPTKRDYVLLATICAEQTQSIFFKKPAKSNEAIKTIALARKWLATESDVYAYEGAKISYKINSLEMPAFSNPGMLKAYVVVDGLARTIWTTTPEYCGAQEIKILVTMTVGSTVNNALSAGVPEQDIIKAFAKEIAGTPIEPAITAMII